MRELRARPTPEWREQGSAGRPAGRWGVGRAGPNACGPAITPLPQAVELALKNNPTVQAADAYTEAVEQGIAVARARRFPRLDFSEGFRRGNNPVYVFGSLITQRQFTAANFALGYLHTPPPLDNFRTQFTAAVPLYDAGQTSRRMAAPLRPRHRGLTSLDFSPRGNALGGAAGRAGL